MSLFRKKASDNAAPKAVEKTVKVSKTKTAKKAEAKKENSIENKKAENAAVVKSKYSYRITEKATKMSDKNVFVLNVSKETNKTELKKELVKKYKVTVLGIRMVNIAKKAKVYRGRAGHRGGGKKAYVTVKAGESIVL